MRNINNLIILFLIPFLFACSQQKTDKKVKIELSTDNLFSINYQDSNYANLDVRDTCTLSGWKVSYRVKNDESKYNVIYLQISKDDNNVTNSSGYHTDFRPGFIPYYIGENSNYIFFLFRCATDCQGLLVMNKTGIKTFTEYSPVYSYDLQLGQILYASEECYKSDDKKYMLAIKDFNRNRDYKVVFNHICTAINRGSCIDSVIFNKNFVTVRTLLKSPATSDHLIVETKTIDLQ